MKKSLTQQNSLKECTKKWCTCSLCPLCRDYIEDINSSIVVCPNCFEIFVSYYHSYLKQKCTSKKSTLTANTKRKSKGEYRGYPYCGICEEIQITRRSCVHVCENCYKLYNKEKINFENL